MNDSELDEFLATIQTKASIPGDELYLCYGDLAFQGNHFCIRTKHCGVPGLFVISFAQETENEAMGCSCNWIELDYRDLKEKWHLY